MEDQVVAIAREFVQGILERMNIEAHVEGDIREGNLFVEIKGDREGILIGKHGRTLEALQLLVNRMVSRRMKDPMRVVVNIDDYRERRADSLTKMATRVGERVKTTGKALTIGPFNAHDRRIIHLALSENPLLETESMGEGTVKKITIRPCEKRGEGT